MSEYLYGILSAFLPALYILSAARAALGISCKSYVQRTRMASKLQSKSKSFKMCRKWRWKLTFISAFNFVLYYLFCQFQINFNCTSNAALKSMLRKFIFIWRAQLEILVKKTRQTIKQLRKYRCNWHTFVYIQFRFYISFIKVIWFLYWIKFIL